MNDYPFVKCLYPRKIRNRYTGEMMIVPCGHCEACYNQKSDNYSKLCDLEERNHKFCFFVTLTYNNRFIPTIYPEKYYDNNKVPYYVFRIRKGQEDRFDEKYFNDERYLLDERQKVKRYYDIHQIDRIRKKVKIPYGGISVSSTIDAQRFTKRLRFYLEKKTSEKIRIFSVSEYGPRTFRFHMHYCVYFNERSTFEAFPEALHKAWDSKLCGFVKFRKSNRDSGDYVSTYINSFTCIPSFLKEKPFRPFTLHSSFFGATRILEDKENVYAQGFDYFTQNRVEIFNKIKPVPLIRSVIHHLYPKCRGFYDKSYADLYNLYTLYYRASSDYNETNVRELARLIYCYPECRTRSYKDYLDSIENQDYKFANGMDIRLDLAFVDGFLSIIEHDLYISKHFIEYVCDSRPSAFDKMIKMIKWFYQDVDYMMLTNWYKSREDDIYNIDDSFWFDNYVQESLDEVCYDWDNNQYYRDFRSKTYQISYDKIKHKELYDLNNIFFNKDT